jgi:hypothetical protein
MKMNTFNFVGWSLFEEHNGLSTKAIKILAIIHEINIMGANGRL